MVIKKIIDKVKKKLTDKKYSNRHLKFYHENKNRLIKERQNKYHQKRKFGVCVRCKKQVVPGIVFCEYHQNKQKEYNQKARRKSRYF